MKLIAAIILLLSSAGCFHQGHDRACVQRDDNGVGSIPEGPGGHGDDQAPVPEPATLAIAATGFIVLAAARRRRAKNRIVWLTF